MKTIPHQYLDLIADESRSFAFLGTLMKDGSPQVTPLWFNSKDENIWINSAKGRIKDANIRRNPQVALSIPDPKDPYRFLQIRGKVIEIREEGAVDHINKLSMKYRGKPYSLPDGQIRVIYIIAPESFSVNG